MKRIATLIVTTCLATTGLIPKQAIPEVRGRFTGRDRLDEPSQQLSGR